LGNIDARDVDAESNFNSLLGAYYRGTKPMPSRRRRNLPFVVRQSAGLALAVPEVMAHRLTRLWLAGPRPSQRDRDEFYRMGAEKLAAFYESWNAMFLEAYRVSLGLAFSPLWWLWLGKAEASGSSRYGAWSARPR
jgi:hypothetical protein